MSEARCQVASGVDGVARGAAEGKADAQHEQADGERTLWAGSLVMPS